VSDDLVLEGVRFFQLLNVCLGHSLLLVRGVEDRGAILRAFVRTLAVKLGWVVRHGEEDL